MLVGSLMWATESLAGELFLFDFGIDVDGTTTCAAGPGCDVNGVFDLSGVAGVDDSGFDYFEGLGSLSVSSSGAGGHRVVLWTDHEIDQVINTFFNESGSTTGTPGAGTTWEIDEPGFVFGDIFDNFIFGALDDANDLDGCGCVDDVSMALGFDFTLAAGETATVDFLLSRDAPASGFYLTHWDSDSDDGFHMSASLAIIPGVGVPAPATLGLLALGLLGFGARRVTRS